MPDETQNHSNDSGQVDHGKPGEVVMPEEARRPEAEPVAEPEAEQPIGPSIEPVPPIQPVPAESAPQATPPAPLPAQAPMPVPRPSDEGGSTEARRPNVPPKSVRYFLTLALESIQFRKRRKLEKIMKFVQEKGSITNDQAEKILHVSDATATRYLSQLVKEGKLKKVGKPERAYYTLP